MPGAKLILLTGAAPGVGRGLPEELVRLGNNVADCGRFAKAVAELACRFPPPRSFRPASAPVP